MIEIGDEVETPTGHIGIVHSYQESYADKYRSKIGRYEAVTTVQRYCQIRLTDINMIEWHGQEYLKPVIAEYIQACLILGEDYFGG